MTADQNCMRTASAAQSRRPLPALFASVAFFASACFGQRFDPVHCSLRSDVQRVRPGDPIALQLTATIEPGWHLYSLTTPEGGPTRTTAVLSGPAVSSRPALYEPAPERRFYLSFNLSKSRNIFGTSDFACVGHRCSHLHAIVGWT